MDSGPTWCMKLGLLCYASHMGVRTGPVAEAGFHIQRIPEQKIAREHDLP
jgi:hypothetical protein